MWSRAESELFSLMESNDETKVRGEFQQEREVGIYIQIITVLHNIKY